jgi:hypothetical protein
MTALQLAIGFWFGYKNKLIKSLGLSFLASIILFVAQILIGVFTKVGEADLYGGLFYFALLSALLPYLGIFIIRLVKKFFTKGDTRP